MDGLRIFVVFAMIIAAFAAVVKVFMPSAVQMHAPLIGPTTITPMPPIPVTSLDRYSEGSQSRLAVYITDENSNWIGIAHGLKTIGVPFILTTDPQRALKHDVVFVYPMISGRLLPADTLQALAQHPLKGGTLIGTNVLGGGLESIFGFEGVRESKDHSTLTFNSQTPEARALGHIASGPIKIGSKTKIRSNPGTNVYLNPIAPPIATYENGDAAIVGRSFETGQSYALGIDLGQLLQKGYNFKEDDISASYANQYQPTLDMLLSFIANIYESGAPDSIRVGTVPNGKKLAVMMTHDVDYHNSVANALEYAKMEARHGVRSTYFIQTKYVNDFNDVSFLDEAGTQFIKDLSAMDLEIASHSVSHSLQFNEFPLGTGEEALPSYQPFVRDSERTEDASLMGELRISKFILEDFSGREVRSFRPGYLRIPRELPQALKWSGYEYSSAVTANKSLTHLPFQLMEDRFYDTEIEIFEFPITIEDEIPPLMGTRLPEAIDVAERLSQYGGTMVTLSHPDILGHKFEFAEGFIKAVKPYAWFGTMTDFGDWWSARNAVAVDVIGDTDKRQIQLSCPETIKGLTLIMPASFGLPGHISGGEVTNVSSDGWMINCTSKTMTIDIAR